MTKFTYEFQYLCLKYYIYKIICYTDSNINPNNNSR